MEETGLISETGGTFESFSVMGSEMSCAPIPRPSIRQIAVILPPFDALLLVVVNDQQAHHGTLLVIRAVNSSRPLQAVAGSSVAPVTPWFEHRRPKQHQGTCEMGNIPCWAA